MEAKLIDLFDGLTGKIGNGYYLRKMGDKVILQKCPDRSGHVKTEKEIANQKRFAEKYGKRS